MNEGEKAALSALDIEAYDDEVILSRRIGPERSSAKINGETVPAPRLKAAGEALLDIYGQKEHESLLKKGSHLALIDAFAGPDMASLKNHLATAYASWRDLKKQWEAADIDASEQRRQIDLLTHEINEIEEAALKEGEDRELEERFRVLSHAEKIREAVSEALSATDGEDGALEQTGRALRSLTAVSSFDENLAGIVSTLSDAEDILTDFNRSLQAYIDDSEFSEETFAEVSARLDLINSLKMKFGPTVTDILNSLEQKQETLSSLQDHENYMAGLKAKLDAAEEVLKGASEQVSVLRRETALDFSRRVREELSDLAFLDVKFETVFDRTEGYTANGTDTAEFHIALNPGEPLRPLTEIASGGELSRIQLAIRTVGSRQEGSGVGCQIFDEIDAGISGRTAQAVAEKLAAIAADRQVLCITHLQSIAAMADRHLLIEKAVQEGRTVSTVRPLDREESIGELGRMIGGADLTETVLSDAAEMKERADRAKAAMRKNYF